ncbi:MAG: tetratricopeptide repeat protein [Cytophagales bacterium]|nr:tetratricopeptide repeat protein [Cytophagales bacterium]
MRRFFIILLICSGLSSIGQAQDTMMSDSVDTEDNSAADFEASMALFEESKLLIEEGQFDQAVEYLRQAYEFYKGNSDYTYAAAYALYKLKRYDEALNKIQWSLSLQPFEATYHVMAGNIAYRSKQFDKGIDYFSQALQYQDSSGVAIDDLSCYYNRGNCFLSNRQYEEAEKDFSEVLSIDETNFMAYHNRAQARLRQKKLAAACEDFNSAITHGSEISQNYIAKYCE